MNREMLVDLIKAQANEKLTKRQINAVLAALPHIAASELAAGREFHIFNFVTFRPVLHRARPGRDPRTGETIQLPERMAAKVTVGQAVRDAFK